METKEALKKALENLEKERGWILIEGRWIQRLKYAIKINDKGQIKRFERKAARAERRINQFEERLFKITDFLRATFPDWNEALSDTENKIKMYNEIILKRVSLIEGTLPKLLKQTPRDTEKINTEVNTVMEKGVQPLIVLLDHLKTEFKRISEESKILEKQKETQEQQTIETSLKQKPFLILFHSVQEKNYVNQILSSRHQLPQSYLGRKLEYAFEADFFWIEHTRKIMGEKKTKMSVFLGHAPHGMTPRNAAKLLGMRHGETSSENLLKRKGLLLPKWLFSRIGRIKLAVEVKSGWGSDERALDKLVKMIKQYHLENNLVLYCFSLWVLEYLKARLPKSMAIAISWKGLGNSIIQFPFNRPFQSLKKWHLFVPPSKIGFVDILSKPAKKSEKGIIKQIKHTTKMNKYHFGARVKTKEQFEWLLKHGARGGLLWIDAKKIIEWIVPKPH
ncbi:MAG: hypothetical protein KAT77_01105 [Nanoarchaeota archaeon]|nr:hypothetical protein [Nanoarchaeota archaeon]